MFIRLLFMLFMSAICSNYAQDSILIGTWQVDDTLLKAGLGDTYRFYPDGSFNYDFGTFNYNSRYSNVSGKYKLQKDLIIFEVEKTTEATNGEISFGDDDYNSWTYINQIYITKRLKRKKSFTVGFEITQDKKILIIEGLSFYKISNDPNAYRDSFRFPPSNAK